MPSRALDGSFGCRGSALLECSTQSRSAALGVRIRECDYVFYCDMPRGRRCRDARVRPFAARARARIHGRPDVRRQKYVGTKHRDLTNVKLREGSGAHMSSLLKIETEAVLAAVITNRGHPRQRNTSHNNDNDIRLHCPTTLCVWRNLPYPRRH